MVAAQQHRAAHKSHSVNDRFATPLPRSNPDTEGRAAKQPSFCDLDDDEIGRRLRSEESGERGGQCAESQDRRPRRERQREGNGDDCEHGCDQWPARSAAQRIAERADRVIQPALGDPTARIGSPRMAGNFDRGQYRDAAPGYSESQSFS